MKKFLIYWLPPIAYVAMIFILSSFSSIPFRPSFSIPDKLVHFCEYLLLAALIARALYSLPWPGCPWLCLLFTMLAVAALGGLDEWYQSTVPRRMPEVLDWVADVSGGLLGAASYLMLKKLRKPRMEEEVS